MEMPENVSECLLSDEEDQLLRSTKRSKLESDANSKLRKQLDSYTEIFSMKLMVETKKNLTNVYIS